MLCEEVTTTYLPAHQVIVGTPEGADSDFSMKGDFLSESSTFTKVILDNNSESEFDKSR